MHQISDYEIPPNVSPIHVVRSEDHGEIIILAGKASPGGRNVGNPLESLNSLQLLVYLGVDGIKEPYRPGRGDYGGNDGYGNTNYAYTAGPVIPPPKQLKPPPKPQRG